MSSLDEGEEGGGKQAAPSPDAQALAAMFVHQAPALLQTLDRRLDSDALDEIVSKLTRFALKGPPKMTEYLTIRAAFDGVVKQAFNHWRVDAGRRRAARRKYEELCGPELAGNISEWMTADGAHNAAELRRELGIAIARLPDQAKDAVLMSSQRISREDIAETLGISVRAVDGLLYRARRTLEPIAEEYSMAPRRLIKPAPALKREKRS
jgi:DNA-binding CsgD family transcriptional regulator